MATTRQLNEQAYEHTAIPTHETITVTSQI